MRLRALFLLLVAALTARAADPVATEWRGIPAWKLTGGEVTAIVVPQLGGRLLELRRGDGPNWIWSGAPGAETKPPTLRWGGDKAYLGPQPAWTYVQGKPWPPPLGPDAGAHPAEVLPGGSLRTTSPAWTGFDDAKITRTFQMTPEGELVITQEIAPVTNGRFVGALWEIAQTIAPDTLYVPLPAESPYKGHFCWFDKKEHTGLTALSPTLLQIKPTTGDGWKIGTHPPQPTLLSIKGAQALLARAEPQEGEYPEGVAGAGFSVEVYHHDRPGPEEYVELEFLSPTHRLDQGLTLTTRWQILTAPATPEAAAQLLARP